MRVLLENPAFCGYERESLRECHTLTTRHLYTIPCFSQAMKLSQHIQSGRDNNFNLIRFVAASLVVFSHSYSVTGQGENEPLTVLFPQHLAWGSLAVNLFFVLSGFLIARSWLEKRDLVAFLYARASRIYPALVVATLFCALIIGPLYTRLPLWQYFTDIQFFKFVAENTTLILKGITLKLPGGFESNISSSNVNTPLWTLPFEVKMYLLIALIGSFGLLGKRALVLAATAADFALYIYLDSQPGHAPDILRLSAFFMAGACAYLYRDIIQLNYAGLTAIAAILVTLFLLSRSHTLYALYLLLPYLVLALAYLPGGPIRRFNRLGDYSYGIYIYAFPIQQALSSHAIIDSPYLMFVLSLALTLLLAVPSWHLLEARILYNPKRKQHIDMLRKHISANMFGNFRLEKPDENRQVSGRSGAGAAPHSGQHPSAVPAPVNKSSDSA